MVDQHPAKPTTVLVVDDEAFLRMDAVEILESKGFRTVEAKNADEALKILADRPDVRVLFTDFNMPGINGIQLARQVHHRWPNVLLIVTSSDRAISNEDIPDHGRFMAKPYHQDTLMREIDNVLKGKPQTLR